MIPCAGERRCTSNFNADEAGRAKLSVGSVRGQSEVVSGIGAEEVSSDDITSPQLTSPHLTPPPSFCRQRHQVPSVYSRPPPLPSPPPPLFPSLRLVFRPATFTNDSPMSLTPKELEDGVACV